ncbi:MAG: hypothetical protein QF662_02365 [Phycisphaerae bacterium]|nr:hypothetical protein [Phycisphaerae bacterium]
MEALKQFLPYILFLLIAGGASLLRRWIEKQQRIGREEEARRKKPAPQRPAHVARKEVRESREEVRAKKEGLGQQRGFGEQHIVHRAKPAAPTRAAAAKPQPAKTRPSHQPKFRRMETKQSTLMGRRDFKSSLRTPAKARQVGTIQRKPGPAKRVVQKGFLGDILRRGNMPRAIVLSEILGPPKGLQ